MSEAAKDLVKKWKNDVGKASAAPSRKASTASTATVSAPTTAAPSKKGNVRSAKTDLNGPVKHTGDATRDKCIELIYDGLALDSTMTPSALLSVSTTVEAAVYAAHDQITGTGYKQRIRMMFSNLKDMKNPQLRERVASGDIEPARFAIMSSQEMASDERKKEVERIKDENLFKSLAAEDQQAETDGFQCGRCKQRKCVYRQAQTRSADEPMTTFVTCTNCGHKYVCLLAFAFVLLTRFRWKFS